MRHEKHSVNATYQKNNAQIEQASVIVKTTGSAEQRVSMSVNSEKKWIYN